MKDGDRIVREFNKNFYFVTEMGVVRYLAQVPVYMDCPFPDLDREYRQSAKHWRIWAEGSKN